MNASRALPYLLIGTFLVAALPTVEGAASPSQPTQTCATGTRLGAWEDQLLVYLGAASSTADPFLTTDVSSSAATEFEVGALSSAPNAATTALQGGLPTPVQFVQKVPFATPYYLNLSKPIIGKIWISSTTLTTTKDGFYLRFDLYAGNDRVGGQECLVTPVAAAAAWHPIYLRFRPEERVFEPGEALTLKVYRMSSTTDIKIGTGGTHASYLEFRYYPSDPLAGPVFIENGKRITGVPTEQPVEDGDQGTWALALLGLASLALARRPLRRRLAPVLVALLLVGVGAAGCLGPEGKTGLSGGAEDEEAPPSSTAEVRTEVNETLKEKESGALRGLVKDDIGLPVAGAHVSLLGTNLFTQTGKDGRFEFGQVTPGEYRLRVDREKFLSLEQTVMISVGEATIVEVTLARPATTTNNLAPHLHDYFDPDGKKILWEGGVLLETTQVGNKAPSAGWRCLYIDSCEAQVPIDPTVAMPPGTSRVEVVVSFSGFTGYQRVGLRVVSPINSSGDQNFLPRASGEKFNVAIFPEESDPGHQQFTNWVYYVWLSNTGSVYNPFGPTVSGGGQMNVKITAFKGVVPYEPGHKDLWNGASEILLFDNSLRTGGAGMVDYPNPSSVTSWKVPKDAYVPTGTKEIRGTLSWTTKNGEPSPHDWTIVFKSARYPQGAPVYKKVTSETKGTNKVDFVIQVDPADVDQFYARASQWIFYPDDRIDPTPLAPTGPNFGFETKWVLSATAYRDPDYKVS